MIHYIEKIEDVHGVIQEVTAFWPRSLATRLGSLSSAEVIMISKRWLNLQEVVIGPLRRREGLARGPV